VFLGERVTLGQGLALVVVLAALVVLGWAERRGPSLQLDDALT
jgi:hypothetical protein